MEEKNISEIKNGPLSKPAKPLLVFILGIFIGLAVIIPGVSGSAIAMMLGLYTAMLYAMGNVFGDFKRCIKFLIPLGIGVVIGFGAGFILIKALIEKFIFEIICLFVGFMIGAFPAISREIKGQKITPARAALFPAGLLIPIAIGIISIFLTLNEQGGADRTFTVIPVWLYFVYFPLGIAVAITQIVPGLSATAILMAAGQFAPIMNSVSISYILEKPQVLGLYASIGAGFGAGLIIFSKLFSVILAKWKTAAFFMTTGMAAGSIICMFINPDMYSLYNSWHTSGAASWSDSASFVWSLAIGVPLLAAGFALSFLLIRIEGKHRKAEGSE